MATYMDKPRGATSTEVIVKQVPGTGMSLNERFSMLKSPTRPPPGATHASVIAQETVAAALQSRVQRAQTVRSAQHEAREHMFMSRRMPQSAISPTSGMKSVQRFQDNSIKTRLGSAPASAIGNVKQRLGSASSQRGVLSGASARGGSRQPLSVRPMPLFRPERPPQAPLSGRRGGAGVMQRLGSAPARTRTAPIANSVQRRQRGAGGGNDSMTATRRTLRGRGPDGLRARLGGRGGRARSTGSGSAATANYGGFDSAQPKASRRGRPAQRGALKGKGLKGRTSTTPADKQEALSKDELDKQLDAYMSKSKAQLDSQLNTYMAHASGGATAMQS